MLGLHENFKKLLKAVCHLTCPPAHVEHLATAVSLVQLLGIENEAHDNDFDVIKSSLAVKRNHHPDLKYSYTEYPVFTALQKFTKKDWPNTRIRYLAVNIYVLMFKRECLDQTKLDPYIFWLDVYYSRDVFLKHLDEFTFSDQGLTSLESFKAALAGQLPKLIASCSDREKTKRGKFNRFFEILTGERLPGKRQKRKSPRSIAPRVVEVETVDPDPSTSDDGAGFQVSYPDEDNFEDSKSYSRSVPSGGSKLSYLDDKRAIHGRVNSQASRNIISVTDIHRFPLPCISAYFANLVSTNLYFLTYFWILGTTGIQPSRLNRLKVEAAERPQEFQGCHLDMTTAVLSYEIISRSNERTDQIMLLGISKKIVSYLSRYDETFPFECMQPEIEKNVHKFSLNHPGQSPTPDRIAASCILHFTPKHFSEIETAYLSGNIPAKLRAQAHYNPINISEVNQKYRDAHEDFINHLQDLPSSIGPMRYELDDFRVFQDVMPDGYLGSVDSLKLSSLQEVLNQLYSHLVEHRKTYISSYSLEKLKCHIQFSQAQQLQLFVIEQLSFCARKFGEKTSYSMSYNMMKLWGSEKASAVASIERKCAPISSLLKQQLEFCSSDIKSLAKLAEKFGYQFDSKFNFRTDPLPVVITADNDKRVIKLTQMNSQSFHSRLIAMNINSMPQPSSTKVNIFKHIMAGALLNKVPQILLDEFMTHDRDGLDFCSDWGTGSAKSMDLLHDAICDVLGELNIHMFTLGENK